MTRVSSIWSSTSLRWRSFFRAVWIFLRFIWVSIFFATIIGCIPSIFFLTTDTAPDHFYVVSWWKVYIAPHFELVIFSFLIFIGLTLFIWTRVQHTETSHHNEDQMRERLLTKVHSFWIRGILEQSLHGLILIELRMHERPDLVMNPWHLILQESNQPGHLLPAGTHITSIYDRLGGELLILGQPGSGKTTLLLELARDLIKRAKDDPTHLIPVVLHLASWPIKKQSIKQWLINELHSKYQVPYKLGKLWVDNNQILPLLDGLDEVTKMYRKECVNAINNYRYNGGNGLVPLVVCSREGEYLDLMQEEQKTLLLCSAVILQPLTEKQIDDYVLNIGNQLVALRTAFHVDRVLKVLASTPLMLNIFIFAYEKISIKDISSSNSSITQQRKEVFRAYVERMLHRRKLDKRYTPQQTVFWLTLLAKQLAFQNQTEFYPNKILPIWIIDRDVRKFMWRFSSGLRYGMICGLILGVIFGVLVGLIGSFDTGILGGIFAGLASATIGFIMAMSGGLDTDEDNPYYKYSYNNIIEYIILKYLLYFKGYMP